MKQKVNEKVCDLRYWHNVRKYAVAKWDEVYMRILSRFTQHALYMYLMETLRVWQEVYTHKWLIAMRLRCVFGAIICQSYLASSSNKEIGQLR